MGRALEGSDEIPNGATEASEIASYIDDPHNSLLETIRDKDELGHGPFGNVLYQLWCSKTDLSKFIAKQSIWHLIHSRIVPSTIGMFAV